jgi:hypothetical protein
VLIVRSRDGAILAAMQGVFADTHSRVKRVLRADVPDEPQLLPALILTKAATAKAHRGQGLNSLLRYHFLRRALQRDVGSVLGCVYPGGGSSRPAHGAARVRLHRAGG